MNRSAVPHAVMPERLSGAVPAVDTATVAPVVADARCTPLFVPSAARTPRYLLNHAPAKLFIVAIATVK